MIQLIAVDGALADPAASRAKILSGVFEDIVNPVDGVVYPAINRDPNQDVVREFHSKIESAIGRHIRPKVTFSRAMFLGMSAPNKIHSDRIMASHAAHIYLSTDWPEGSGTSFWEHKVYGPVHDDRVVPADIRANEMSDWSRLYLAQAAFNRMLVHRGDLWHLAEPIGGWGDKPENARLVITCFFD